MRFLRTNTAVIITVGPFYDKTDGVTIETALTITNERITMTADTDDGSAPTNVLDNVTGATSGTSNDLNYITGNDAGMMQLELTAANTNRLGRMFLSITDAANHVPVFHEFMVLPAMIYDAFILGTDRLDTNVTHVADTAQSAGDLKALIDAVDNFVDTEIADIQSRLPAALVSGRMDASVGAMAANVMTAAAAAADLTTELQSGLATAAALDTVDNFLDTEIADIQARLPAALTADGNIKADTLRVGGTLQSAGDLKALIDAVDNFVDTEIAAIQAAIAALNNLSAAQVNAEVVDALAVDTYAESAAVPAATASLAAKIQWLGTLARNKITQTSTTQLVRNDADSGTIGTSTVSDDGTTFIRGEFS